jgi:tight adherence protein C
MANECWETRKNITRKLGEEASTKMILPLMLMFGAILLIVATPAVLALQGI